MNKIIITSLVFFLLAGCKNDKSPVSDDSVFRSTDYKQQVDKLPEIKGGIEALQKNVIYPSEAKEKGIEGKVIVQVFINENGVVNKAEILKSDNKLLEQAAIDALKRTKFTAGMVKGEAVKTQIVVPIMFKLGDGDKKTPNHYPDYLSELDEYPVPEGGVQSLAKNIIYPESDKKKGIQGQVLVLALISESGDVVKTEIVKGVSPGLDKAALEAIKKTKFTPAKKDGALVKAQVQIPVTFKLK